MFSVVRYHSWLLSLSMHSDSPEELRIILPQVSVGPKLGNSDEEDPAENAEALGNGGATEQKDLVSLNHNIRGRPPNTHTEVLDEST